MSGQADIYNKQYLMTAGPTPIPPAVSQVMAEPISYHRAPAFIEVHARALERLRSVFQTSNEVLSFTASGTGAMESAVANLAIPGEPIAVASSGKFGERWAELGEAYGADVSHLDIDWGERVEPAALAEFLAGMKSAPRAVYVTQSETSTGVVNDVRGLAEAAHEHGAVICVDAISGLGAVDLPQDEWGVDVVVSGSQKSLMCPPGLAFASANERALELADTQPGRHYYFGWARTLAGQREDEPSSPFTPAVTLWRALDVALGLILDEGLARVFERHAILARAARAGVEMLGLERFGPDDDGANVVTAALLPDSIAGAEVPKLMRDRYGVTAAGGQGRLKGRIVRIAHCGYYGAFDILSTIAALEMTLKELGADVTLGAGVSTAQQVFLEAGMPAVTPVA